jgi:hypothetical protein
LLGAANAPLANKAVTAIFKNMIRIRLQQWIAKERTHGDEHDLDRNILFTIWRIILPLSSLVFVTYLGRCTQNGVGSPILCPERTILELVRSL